MAEDKLFDEIKNITRSKQIVEKFKDAIAEGVLKTGDKLPPERQLCLQLGVSRTSLREAIRILETYGVLEATHGGGTYVTDKFTENVFEFLGFGDILKKQNFKHLLQVRNYMESGAVEAAVAAADDEAVNKLERLVDSLEGETDKKNLGLLDACFHETVIELSGNPILTAMYRMIFKMLLRGTSKVISYPSAKNVAVRDHREILDCFRKKDWKRCRSVVHKHLMHTERLIDKYFVEKEEAQPVS